MSIQFHEKTFAALFKKYRLRSEIDTLSEFGDLLTQEGLTYETSLFTRWQNGERVPRDRRVLLAIIRLFTKLGGIKDIREANTFFEAVDQRDLSDAEIYELHNNQLVDTQTKNHSKLKVFFFSSPIFTHYDQQASSIYNEIANLGYVHIFNETQTHYLRGLIKEVERGEDSGIDEYKKNLLETIEKVKIADICIFETSTKTIGTGYLIHQSMIDYKPTILLYYKKNRPHIFSVQNHKNLILKSYTNTNIQKVIKNVMMMASETIIR